MNNPNTPPHLTTPNPMHPERNHIRYRLTHAQLAEVVDNLLQVFEDAINTAPQQPQQPPQPLMGFASPAA